MSLITCVDSIVSPETTRQPIPAQIMAARAILAYSYGNSWPTFGPYSRARPDLARAGWIISTTLTANGPARCYDIEPGGGSNANVGRFMRQADRSHGLPILYTFASNGQPMLNAAAAQGFHRGRDFYYLSAHPGRGQHICGPGTCGYAQADGTQYEFAGAVDYSILPDYMLPKLGPPVERAKGLFVAELHYDHDKGAVALYPKAGHVDSWGNVNEWIHLDAALAVGSKPGAGEWAGRVHGATPR